MRPPDDTDDRIFYVVRDFLYNLNVVELAAHCRHTVIDSLILHLGIDLRGLDVAVSQHL